MKNKLNEKGHLVRNIINVRHRATKEPLPLLFVDLEPRNNNKEIYQLQFLQHCKIRVEPPRHKRVIAQCTRRQSYGQTKGWLHTVHGAKAMVTQKGDCTMYTAPKLWSHTRVIAQCTRRQSYGHTKGWLHNVHGAKAMVTQKVDCTMYTAPKLWSHIYLLLKATTQLTTFLSEVENMFSQLVNQNSMILSMLTTVIYKLTQWRRRHWEFYSLKPYVDQW
jgi:hypothetical protein